MAEGQIASPNQPYGDVFFYQTPYTDAAVARLQQEARMRQAQQQEENRMLDTQFQKELGKVRSIDQPDIIQGWQRVKELNKRLLFDKQLKKDPYAYNQLRQEATAAYADLMRNSTKSAELKSQAETIFQDRIKNPDNYVDEFGGLMTAMQQTPLSQGGKLRLGDQEIDLFNPDTYRYKGGNYDFGKVLKDASGPLRVTGSITEPVGKEGLQMQVTPYSYGNNPAQVRDYLLGNFAQRNAGRAAAYQWMQTPPEEIERITQAYRQLPADRVKRMGLSQLPDLARFDPNNPAANYANLLAMKYAVDTEPILGKPELRTNQEALLNKQQAQRKELEAIRRGNQEALARLKDKLKGASTQEQMNWLTAFVDDTIQEAENEQRIGDIPAAKELKLSPALKKALGGSDVYRVTPEGDIMFFKYQRYGKYEEPEKGDKRKTVNEGDFKKDQYGNLIPDETSTGRMSKQQFKALIGKQLIGVKALNEALDAEDFGDEEPEAVDINTLRNKYNY